MSEKRDEMKKIKDDLLGLKESPLYKYRIENKFFPVIGEGSHDAEIVFIGEAPGKKEAMTGKPFCGASGKVLDELLAHIKVDREKVYITNVVKDRPENNRDPKPSEIELYSPFLDKQLEIIKPKFIATLGRFSMEYIMKKFNLESKLETISKLHGKKFKTKTNWGDVYIVPLYHPAVAVYNRNQLPLLKKDFEMLSNHRRK
jgi:uracil-DNA glycosylase